MIKSKTTPSIICFGEVLWDCLPRGIFLGGAPLNVAYHLSRHGLRALPVSAVGRDFLGREALRRISTWGIDTHFVSQPPAFPTGTVQAVLDKRGSPGFQIARSAAWDRITLSRKLRKIAPPAAIIHGTLALRETQNRRVLTALFKTWPDTLRVVDLNLRAPFDKPAPIVLALTHAQFVKLNNHELARLTGTRSLAPAKLETATRHLAKQYAISKICVTAGRHGAGLLCDDSWHWTAARPVKIRDTVGAGDAFLGGLLAGLLHHRLTPQQALLRARELAEFVAGQDGPTPPYTCDARGRIKSTTR